MLVMRVWHSGLAFCGLAVAISACSLALNWNQDGLPCEYDAASSKYSCLSGYTCALRNLNDPNDNLCIQNGSIPADGNCQKDIQCTKGYTCPRGTCLAVCDPNDAYTNTSTCPLSQYCKAFYTTSGYTGRDTPHVNLEGACVDSDGCSKGNACTPDGGTANSGICLAVDAAATACVLGCSVSFLVPTVASSYQDACQPVGDFNSSCQAVGPLGNEVTACVTQFPNAVANGTACNNSISQPCQVGSTCWAGECAAWCPVTSSPSSVCGSGEYCCPATSLTNSQSSSSLGYCVSGTSANCSAN